MMKSNIPIFIINLKKDINKKKHMEALCKLNNLQCQFIEAVYGKNLDKETLSKVYSKEESINEIGRELTSGEIGCALSHLHIYKYMINQNIEKAIIFEDDIQIEKGLSSVLNTIDNFPDHWELILLGYHQGTVKDKETKSSLWSRKKITAEHTLVRLIRIGLGTHGYLINLKGAKKLTTHLSIIKKPIDHYTGDDQHINVYAVSPRTIRLDSIFNKQSNIKEERLKMENRHNSHLHKKMKLIHKLQRELSRPLKQLLNYIKLCFDQIKPLKKYINSKPNKTEI